MIDGLKPYPAYKDPGVPWLGKVPEHWEILPPKRALRTESVGTAAIKNTAETTPLPGFVPAFSASGQDVWLPEPTHEGSALVLSAVGARCGKTFRADGRWAVVANTHVLWPRDGQNRDFWWHVTNNEDWWLRGGAAQPFVQVRATLDRPWVIPPLPEQTAIVRFLDYMDRRIRRVVHARQRQIKLLEEYRQALIHQAVTGQIDVRTGKPYPAYKDSGVEWLGQVPEHWEVRRGKTLFKRVQRPVRPEDDVVTCFRDGIVTLRRNRRTEGFTESLKEIGYQGIRRGDLVIHAMDAFAGAVGVADCDGKGSPVYTVCIPSREANQYYFAHVLREMARSGWILALATGIRERSTDFRFGTCGSQILPLPPLPEQTAIVEYLDAQTAKIDAAIAAARREIELLREYRERLIADVVTGKVDVREVAARLPEEPPEEDSEWMGTEEMADEDTADEESGAEVLSEEGDL